MVNPRFIGKVGEPTQELLGKLHTANDVYFDNLPAFCDKWGYDIAEMSNFSHAYLIGSHAEESGWMDDTSDVDFKLVMPDALPEACHKYKRDVLNPILCPQDVEKRRWIDLFFVREDYQVLDPKYDVFGHWEKFTSERK